MRPRVLLYALLGIIGLSYLAARGIYRQIVQRRQRFLEDLMDALTVVLEESIHLTLPAEGAVRLQVDMGRIVSGFVQFEVEAPAAAPFTAPGIR